MFLPEESHRQRNLAGYSPYGHRVRHSWGLSTHARIWLDFRSGKSMQTGELCRLSARTLQYLDRGGTSKGNLQGMASRVGGKPTTGGFQEQVKKKAGFCFWNYTKPPQPCTENNCKSWTQFKKQLFEGTGEQREASGKCMLAWRRGDRELCEEGSISLACRQKLNPIHAVHPVAVRASSGKLVLFSWGKVKLTKVKGRG